MLALAWVVLTFHLHVFGLAELLLAGFLLLLLSVMVVVVVHVCGGRDVFVLLVRGRFRGQEAPESRGPRIRRRIWATRVEPGLPGLSWRLRRGLGLGPGPGSR